MAPVLRIRLVFIAFLLMIGLAFALPALTAGGQTGLAAAATAALTLMVFALLATACAVILLVMGIRHRAAISLSSKILAFLPLPLLLVAGMIFYKVGQQKQTERSQVPPTPTNSTRHGASAIPSEKSHESD